MDEIKVYRSRWKAAKIIFLGLAFGMAGFCLMHYFNAFILNFIGWVLIAFFASAVILGLYNLADRRAQLIINETGVFHRESYKDFINWNAIEHAYWNTIYGRRFVCLIIKDDFKDLIKTRSAFNKAYIAAGLQEINIDLNDLSEVDQQKLTALIINLSNAGPIDRSKILTSTRPLE